MILTPHILTGVAIITFVQNPILGLIFVLLSHYLLDLPPHTEYNINVIRAGQWNKSLPDFFKVFLDIALGLAIVFFTTGYTPLVLAAATVSLFPDGLTLLYCAFPANKLLRWHMKIHMAINGTCENKKIPAIWGIASQVVIMAIAIYLLL